MISSVLPKNNSEVTLSDADFSVLAKIVKREFGLDLTENKKSLVYSRISKRLRARGVSDFSEYIWLIESKSDKNERQALISALTTNVTSFFREKHHFDTLQTEILMPMLQSIDSGGRLRIWSAGCSYGQEAYSIALTIMKNIPNATNKDVKILATDIDPLAVESAKSGRYKIQSSNEMHIRNFDEFISIDGNSFEVCAECKSLISFAELNLIDPWPIRQNFDAIFCRNVAIYFDRQTQNTLWTRFSKALKKNGYMFIGHSERVSGSALENFTASGITTYKKSNPTTNNGRNGNSK